MIGLEHREETAVGRCSGGDGASCLCLLTCRRWLRWLLLLLLLCAALKEVLNLAAETGDEEDVMLGQQLTQLNHASGRRVKQQLVVEQSSSSSSARWRGGRRREGSGGARRRGGRSESSRRRLLSDLLNGGELLQ